MRDSMFDLTNWGKWEACMIRGDLEQWMKILRRNASHCSRLQSEGYSEISRISEEGRCSNHSDRSIHLRLWSPEEFSFPHSVYGISAKALPKAAETAAFYWLETGQSRKITGGIIEEKQMKSGQRSHAGASKTVEDRWDTIASYQRIITERQTGLSPYIDINLKKKQSIIKAGTRCAGHTRPEGRVYTQSPLIGRKTDGIPIILVEKG